MRPARSRRLSTLAALAAESTPAVRWERLLSSRGWLSPTSPSDPPDEDVKQRRLLSLSQKLSFPLTVGFALPRLQLPEAGTLGTLCVLGAREEADSVPIAAWLELCAAMADVDMAPQVRLKMIGPEVNGEERSLSAGELYVSQDAPIRACFEEVVARDPSALLLPDAFVLFNPGLHAGKYTWRPTLEAVLDTGRPVILSAYSDQDAASDAQWLSELCTRTPSYEANPWASLQPWSYEGCGTMGEAHANTYVTVLHGREPSEPSQSGRALVAPRVPTVPAEQAWLRRSAMRDFFDDFPKVLREFVQTAFDLLRGGR